MNVKLSLVLFGLTLFFSGATIQKVTLTTTITVTTTDDEVNNDGDCSLREAIIAANNDVAVDNCPAGSGVDQINLPAGHYVLSIPYRGNIADEDSEEEGDLDITENLSIFGAGAQETIVDANRVDRVFDIAPDTLVLIEDVTITGGQPTSAVWKAAGINVGLDSKLTLNNSFVVKNDLQAGIAIAEDARLVLNHSQIDSNTNRGLFLAIESTATIRNSAIVNNSAERLPGDHGGGILTFGTLRLINSTISGNRARGDGGGIYNFGETELYSVTISNNTANSDDQGVGYGGGIFNDDGDTVTMGHTIISGNHSAFGFYRDCYTADNSNPFISTGYNLIEDTDRCHMTGDLTGNLLNVDPQLGPLQNNGGNTSTHALLDVSPAIDAGSLACLDYEGLPLTTDQRGFRRPVNATGTPKCDIGAYEYEFSIPLTPTPTATATSTATPTATSSPTPTATPSPTPTATIEPAYALFVPLIVR
ncbi:MAG: choice-of-anchor Q domain-containing protein [Ardenticatenaceae bacterium]|nr:choice-of-anchor Q domain-containing protein [Ardenticatenaceae bacterium]